MVPKRKQILEGHDTARALAGSTSLLLAAMRMTFPSGDTKLMTFTDVKPNAAHRPGQLHDRRRGKSVALRGAGLSSIRLDGLVGR